MKKFNLLLVLYAVFLAASMAFAQPEAVPQYVFPPETRQLLQQLRSLDAGQRVAAAMALRTASPGDAGLAGTRLLLGALTEALGDADPRVRQALVQTFIGYPRFRDFDLLIQQALLLALRDGQAGIRTMVVDELGKRYADLVRNPENYQSWPIDPHLLPELARLQDDPDPAVRRAVLLARGRIGVPEALEPLLALLADPVPATRAVVLAILEPYADPRIVPALAAALQDTDPGVRLAAARALARRHDPRGIDVLAAAVRAADNPDAEMLTELGQFRDPRVTAVLLELLAKNVQAMDIVWMEEIPDPYGASDLRGQGRAMGRQIIGLLEGQGAVAVPPLLERLTDDSALVRQAALIVLMHIGDRRAVPGLIAALGDEAPAVRRVAARALRVFGDVSTLPALTAALRDPDPALRGEAALALGGVQDTRAVPALMEALHDPVADVQFAAAWALGRIPDPRAVEPLIAALTTSVDRGVRERSAEALGYIADPRAVPSLVAALGDENLRVRDRAALALGLIGDRAAVEPLLVMLNDPTYQRPDANIVSREDLPIARNRVRTLGANYFRLSQEYRGCRPSAALALGMIGDPRAIDPLTALLKEEPWLCEPAIKALAAIPDIRAAQALFALDPENVQPVRQEFIYGRVRDAAAPWLVTQLRSPDAALRARAACYLRRMAGPDYGDRLPEFNDMPEIQVPGAADALAPLLQDRDPDVRREAALALATYGDRRAIPALLALFHENDQAFQVLLVIAPFIDDPAVRKTILADIVNPDPGICFCAISAAQLMGPDALQSVCEPLAALLKQPVSLQGSMLELLAFARAATALGMLDDPRALEPLLRLLEIRDNGLIHLPLFDFNIEALLAQSRDPRAREALRQWPDPQPVELYYMKNPPAEVEPAVREQLLTNLHHEDILFRLNTMELFVRMKARWAVPALIGMLDDPTGAGDLTPRAAAASALARIGDPAAVAPLIAHLETGDLNFRQAAAAALGQLSDPRAIPPLIDYLEHIAGYQFRMTGESWQPDFKPVRPIPVQALKTLTGQDFGEDAAKWRQWWEANGKQ